MVRVVEKGGEARWTLRGKQVAITGRLASMTRDEAADWVRRLGGEPTRAPSRKTAIVVVGEESWSFRKGSRPPEGLERAKRLQEEGCALEVISEQRFLEMLPVGADDSPADVQRLYTTTQLSRILKVSGRRIRAWVRRGLIRPARTVHRLDWFDFRQMTELKMLRELTEGGVTVAEIRRSLRQLKRWLPQAEQSLARLAKLEGEGQLLVRVEGHLAEPSGQLRLDFGDAGPSGAAAPVEAAAAATTGESAEPAGAAGPGAVEPAEAAEPEALSAEERFETAVALEEQGRFAEAAAAYELARAAGGESAEIAFNLGNVLCALGRTEEAVARFEEALEVDPQYVEAWNNLASVRAELGQWRKAIEAGCRAVDLAYDYPDAHFNLAEAYHAAGRRNEARRHARIYLKFDPRSDWASELREKLGL